MPSLRMWLRMEWPFVWSSLEVTRRQSLLRRGRTNLTHSIYPMGWSTTMSVVLIAMQSPWLPFWLSQRVGFTLTYWVPRLINSSVDREHQNSAEFREFRFHLFHDSLRQILTSFKEGMTTSEVVRYGDGHYRRTIYGLGPYIADYPEQVLLACIVQGWCCRCFEKLWNVLTIWFYARCTALHDDLDGDVTGCRTHELTQLLMEGLSSSSLWDDYRISW